MACAETFECDSVSATEARAQPVRTYHTGNTRKHIALPTLNKPILLVPGNHGMAANDPYGRGKPGTVYLDTDPQNHIAWRRLAPFPTTFGSIQLAGTSTSTFATADLTEQDWDSTLVANWAAG